MQKNKFLEQGAGWWKTGVMASSSSGELLLPPLLLYYGEVLQRENSAARKIVVLRTVSPPPSPPLATLSPWQPLWKKGHKAASRERILLQQLRENRKWPIFDKKFRSASNFILTKKWNSNKFKLVVSLQWYGAIYTLKNFSKVGSIRKSVLNHFWL